jgi:predicted HAD superfamily Cof-like phosphohydrolase
MSNLKTFHVTLAITHDGGDEKLLAEQVAQHAYNTDKVVNCTIVPQIIDWFKQAVPVPSDKHRSVQLGVHVEEVSEMFEAMHMATVATALGKVADYYKQTPDDTVMLCDRDPTLNSLCDQIVTATGVAYMFGMDIQGALNEVNRSNWSKFVDGKPVFDANGKIAKPPTYSKPDLSPFVGVN